MRVGEDSNIERRIDIDTIHKRDHGVNDDVVDLDVVVLHGEGAIGSVRDVESIENVLKIRDTQTLPRVVDDGTSGSIESRADGGGVGTF